MDVSDIIEMKYFSKAPTPAPAPAPARAWISKLRLQIPDILKFLLRIRIPKKFKRRLRMNPTNLSSLYIPSFNDTMQVNRGPIFMRNI